MITSQWKKALIGVTFLTATVALAACESKEDKSQRFAESGMAYLEEGDIESANLQFNNSLFNNGKNLTALRGAAQIAATNKAYVRQGRMLARILEVVPDDIEANNEFARLSLLANEIERSKEHANKVLSQDPENVTALTTLAAALVLEDKLEESADILRRALAADPNNPEIYNLIAAQSIRSGDFDQAIAILDDGVSKVENPETLLVVRLVLADQHLNEDEVISTFEQLIEASPDNGTYRQKLAEYVLLKQQDFARAEALFEAAVPYLEDPTPALTRIVAIERQTNGDEAAEAKLKSFINQNADNAELRFLLPTFYCQTEQFDECVGEFETLAADETISEDDRSRARNGVADVAIVRRDFDRAQEVVDEILAVDPNNAGALITQGQILLSKKQPIDAIESLRTALESEPDNSEGLVYLALAYEASDQDNFADAQFARALDQVGYLRPVVDQYRAFLIRRGEFERSMDVLERYLRANPDDKEAQLQRAEGAIAQGEFLEAEASARNLITTQGNDTGRAGSILAQSLFSQKRFTDALPVTEEILAQNPDDHGNKILRASILQRLGRANEAIDELEEKIESGEAVAIDYALLGDLLNGKQDFAGARSASIEGLRKFPEAEQLYVLGYIAESRMDNTEGATAILRDGMTKVENSAQIRNLLSNELVNQRRYEEAIEVLRSLARDNALSPLTANNLASLLLDVEGASDEALATARLLEGTENAYFADTLAWAYYNADQVQNAMRYGRLAAEKLPNNADVQYHHGMIEAALGNPQAAQIALEKALEVYDDSAQTPRATIANALSSL